MTTPVIHTLDESTAHLFHTMPDPLAFRDKHRSTRYRPDWQRIAVRDGRTVARAAWWGRPEDPEPLVINWFDVADGEEEAGAELLRTAPWRTDELELDLPAGWRTDARQQAAADVRAAAARAAGYAPLVERLVYRWTPDCGLPERPGRLLFSGEPDDAVFFGLLRRIHSVTLDAHALRAIEQGGPDRAAQQELDVFRWFPSPRAWWRIARTPEGETVGIHIPARNPSGPCVGFIGVVPEQRGHGYAYDLLAECTHFLAAQGAEFIAAATDRTNLPMAAHFTTGGYPVVRERINFWSHGVVSTG